MNFISRFFKVAAKDEHGGDQESRKKQAGDNNDHRHFHAAAPAIATKAGMHIGLILTFWFWAVNLGFGQQSVTLTWDQVGTNQTASGITTGYIVAEGPATYDYENFYFASTNGLAIGPGSAVPIPPGQSHWAVMQNGALATFDGEKAGTSGEVVIQSTAVFIIGYTNVTLGTSTNLGMSFQPVMTNGAVVFPNDRVAQRFFTVMSAQATITQSNRLALVPSMIDTN